MKTKTLDLFVTDTDYDLDQTAIGYVYTTTAGLQIECGQSGRPEQIPIIIGRLKAAMLANGLVVRFVSTSVTTDFITVRAIGDTNFTVDNAVDLPIASGFKCYIVRPWVQRPLQLATRFQHVVAVELVAYALVGLSSLTLWEDQSTSSAPPSIDFVGLEIKELPGRAMSTNRYMQNMLAVLPTHAAAYHPSSWTEAKDSMIFVPHCMMKTTYDQPLVAVNTLTPRLVDRRGDPVMAARFHLWLRLTVLDQ
jgi:hypothetical protein